jgi:transposase
MIAVPAGMRVLVATKPIDFRKGADGLVALVRETLGHDPFSGTIFVFRAKRADRIKIVAWDGSGPVLFWKRLEHDAFRWPPITNIDALRALVSQLTSERDLALAERHRLTGENDKLRHLLKQLRAQFGR